MPLYIGLAVIFCCGFMPSMAQEQSIVDYLADCQRKYGSDADLVNGEKYFYPYSNTDGDPFLVSSSQLSSIRIKDKDFEDQQVKYDIYNQQLVLEYNDLYGGVTSLVIRDDWVESFSYGPGEFKNMVGPEGEEGFFQVIHEGKVSCYYRWIKEYKLNLVSGVQSYYFTDPVRESFLVLDDHFHQFRNNRGFLKVFGTDQQKAIKSFMRQSRMKIKKSPVWQMRNLMEYCNSLKDDAS